MRSRRDADGDAVWPHDEELHAWWVEYGKLLAGEYPGSLDADQAVHKLELLIGAGVDSIVDLTVKNELRTYATELKAVARRADREVRYFSCPIPDMGVIDDAGYDEITDLIRGELDARRAVYVHCWGGMGRTTTVIGCLLADAGLGYESVIDRISALRAHTRKASVACPQTRGQRDVIRRRCDRVAAK